MSSATVLGTHVADNNEGARFISHSLPFAFQGSMGFILFFFFFFFGFYSYNLDRCYIQAG